MKSCAFREIAFIDPAISHLDLFVAGLRPGVEAVLLPRNRDALAAIASVLEGNAGLDAIHIVAHGRPGELSFAAGALNIKTIDQHRAELAQIGDALGSDGTIALWSCETGAGWQGACFVEALERATGAEIAASQGLIGAASKGGTWNFGTERFIAAQAPLTTAAIQTYEGVMATVTTTAGTDTFTGTGGANNTTSGTDQINVATGTIQAADSIDGGGGTDTMTVTTTGDGVSVDFSVATISNVENLTTVDQAGGQSYDQTLTISAAQWAAFSSIDMNDGSDILNVFVSGTVDISGDATNPTVSDVETSNLTGSSGSDTITLTGAQLNAILLGGGTINLGTGTNTINLTSTSTDLNGLANGSLTNVQNISAATAAAAVTIDLGNQTEAFTITGSAQGDTLEGGSGADTIDGGAGTDTITGGDSADTMTGGADSDVFNFSAGDGVLSIGGTLTNGTISGYDVITDFTSGATAGASEKLDFQSATILGDTAATNGNNSTLQLNSASTVKSHSITDGIITFDDDDTFGGAVSLTTIGDVAAVVQYLQANNPGTGNVVAFTATISGVEHTYVFRWSNGTLSNDVLIDLQDVTADSISAASDQVSVIELPNAAPSAVTLLNTVGAVAENGGSVKVADIVITDDGQGTNTLSLSGADALSFSIQNGDELWFNGGADFESQISYDVTVEVDDTSVGGTPDASTNFTLNITDVDEFDVTTPVDNNGTANAVDENAVAGTVVGVTALASDADGTTNGVTYALTGNPGGLFAIDTNTGVVTVLGAIDRESTGPSVTIEVTATSQDGSTASEDFVIAINDLDEFDVSQPVDTDVAANAVDENAVIGTTVGLTASATDADATNSGVTYAITGGTGASLFTIDTNTGVVTVNAAIDREALSPSQTLEITATSQDSSTNVQTFTIDINNVDEFDPLFDAADYPATVAEDIADTTVIATVSATDADATGAVTYAITGGNGAGLFEIDSVTGEVSLASGQTLDAETATAHVLTITATESDGLGTDISTVTITVTDVDEFDVSQPVDTDGAAGGAVDENAAFGATVGVTASATDADVTNNVVTYAITGGTGNGFFNIDANTGVVTVGTAINRESVGPSLDIEVTATSTDGSTNVQTFSIDINDVDEFNPVFDAADYPATVAEDLDDATVIATVAATEDDATGTVTYAITGGNGAGLFEIDANTGEVSLASGQTLDAETATNHVLTITASESDGAETDTATVTITVTDVDEFDVSQPVDDNNDDNVVNENAANGTTVGLTASATDNDLTNSGVTYAITGGTGAALFTIDTNTGVVTVNAAIDREALGPSVTLEITATSQDSSTNSQTFTIDIGDVDEFDPVFNAADYPATVAEDLDDATVIATAAATEDDATGTVTYAITGGNEAGLFEIDSVTGEVSLASGQSLDAETATAHVLTITASESDGAETDTSTVTITVTDVDEFDVSTPVDTDNDDNAVNENAANGTTVGITASASDDDLTNSGVTYSITGGTGLGLFAIDANTGIVTVAAPIDSEAVGASLTVEVTATSDDSSTSTQTFTIDIIDADEFDPVFNAADYPATVAEDLDDTTVIATVAATEDDATGTVTYAITGGNEAGLFEIDSVTGEVSLASGQSLDAETATLHTLTITASESDGAGTDTSTVTITVTDVDEFDVSTPVDVNAAANAVNENAANGTTVGVTASASDDDLTNSGVTYAITGGTGLSLFAIDANTGVVTVASPIDSEAVGASLTVEVTATSQDTSTSVETFTIDINDVDEVAPTITSGAVADAIDENSGAGQVVYTATADDTGDISGGVTFSLGGVDAGLFSIDSGTGEVTLTGDPDFEGQSSYSFTVLADDGVNPPTEQTVTLAVNNLDEDAPDAPSITQVEDDELPGVGNISNGGKTNDNTPTIRVSLVGTGAVDGDRVQLYNNGVPLGAAIFLTLGDVEGTGNGFIDITPAALADGDYDLSATIIDQADNESDASATHSFEVDTIVGATPTGITLIPSTVAENSVNGTVVGTLGAIDTDPVDTFTFSLLDDGDGHFAIVGNQLVVVGPLDFETDPTFAIEVLVTDSDDNTFSDTFVIDVGDVNGNTIRGTSGNDKISTTKSVKGQPKATIEEDSIRGLAGNDKISAGGGNDIIKGGAGNDRLEGGLGADKMFGNAGADKFVFRTILDSTTTSSDTIVGFKHSQADKIDLHLIDANSGVAGNQAFTYIGGQAFSGSTAGQLRFDIASHKVQADIDGDGQADFAINVNVAHLVKGDFVL
jgi:protocadherin Fat 4